jgi:hypothetical protein
VTPTNDWVKQKITLRDFFRVMAAASVTAVASTVPSPAAAPEGTQTVKKIRRARYQADSPDVQAFYRVNRYPAK